MKIQKINDTDYVIYIFSSNYKEEIKDVIKRIQKLLKLNGFYKVIVNYKKIGSFIKLIRLEDAFYKNTLDLKIEEVDEDIYFKTKDYFIIKDCFIKKYFDEYYYALVDDSFDKILEKVEFGDFVFGYEFDISR